MSDQRRWRRGAAALGVAAAALAAVAGIGAIDTVGRPPAAALAAPPPSQLDPAPVATPTSASTSLSASVSTAATPPPAAVPATPATAPLTPVNLPVPANLPLDAYAPTPDEVIGHLTIPAIGLDEDIHVGMTLTAINRGPSWWPGTAQPGQLGNVVIGGHRTTFTHPFEDLDRLVPGDPVVFTTAAGTFTYQVVRTVVVDPSAVEIADQTVDYTATLFACHPPGSARYRIVVHLHLVDGDGHPVPPPNGVTVVNTADTIRYRG